MGSETLQQRFSDATPFADICFLASEGENFTALSQDSAGTVPVSITAYGLWQMWLRAKNLKFEFSGRTLGDLIEVLAKMGERDFVKDVLKPQGGLADGLKVYLNGVSQDDLSAHIESGDDVTLISMFDGG